MDRGRAGYGYGDRGGGRWVTGRRVGMEAGEETGEGGGVGAWEKDTDGCRDMGGTETGLHVV